MKRPKPSWSKTVLKVFLGTTLAIVLLAEFLVLIPAFASEIELERIHPLLRAPRVDPKDWPVSFPTPRICSNSTNSSKRPLIPRYQGAPQVQHHQMPLQVLILAWPEPLLMRPIQHPALRLGIPRLLSPTSPPTHCWIHNHTSAN